ncbi:MAG TPA: pitrilysin family protein [Candidatus Methylomirabilis sp.]|nr:pitrilysin family protein [Candidatus Methylomirabilis sp.]
MTQRRLAFRIAAALALGLAVLPACAAAADESFSRTRLPNGLTLLVRENPVAPVVAVSLQVKMGTRWETRESAGISNLVQLMLVRGTTTLNGNQIVEAADRMGGTIDARGDADTSEISATALARYWSEILDLVADVALHPTIPEGTFRAVRDFLIRQVRNRGDRPFEVAMDTLTDRIFSPHPYAWDPIGLRESLERIDRNALIQHDRRHYVPAGIAIAVSGRVSAAEVQAKVERLFSGMSGGSPPVAAPPEPPPPAASRDALAVPGAQAQIMMGRLGPTFTDADFPAVKVLSSILGGGMAGRLFSRLRDKQALAYTTATQCPWRVDKGYLLALLGTAPENVERAQAALASELARIQQEPVSEEELQIGKASLLGDLEMDRRTNARQAWYMASLEIMGVGYEFLDRYVSQVRAVTVADVQRVAQRYLSPLRTVIVAPPPK